MFWKDLFLQKNARWWMRKITDAKIYDSSTSTWIDTQIVNKGSSGNLVYYQILISGADAANITAVRLIDEDGDVAFEGTQTITTETAQGAVVQIDVTIMEIGG